MRDVLPIQGVESLDIDETLNRVVVRVTQEPAKAAVLDFAATAGVPSQALVVNVVPAGHLLSTLQDYARPLVGGLLIDPFLDGVDHQCTLGINVLYTNQANGVPVGTPGVLHGISLQSGPSADGWYGVLPGRRSHRI